MTSKRIEDLANVEVEHLLGLATGLPLVKLRCESDGTVLVGQIDPVSARKIAADLMTCAARAEYEVDFLAGAELGGIERDMAIPLLHMVRDGEADRMRRETGE